MTDVESLQNIGPELGLALRGAGITTADELRAAGAVDAWWRVHPRFDCVHSLLALEGAVQGIPKRALDEPTRARLRAAMAASPGDGQG